MHHRMYGRRNDQIVRDFYGDNLTDEEVIARGAAKEQLYREMVAAGVNDMLVPGIKEFLDRHASLPMALATNGERANVDFLLEKAGLRSHFSVVIDGHQVQHPKPDPEIYLLAAAQLKTAPSQCIVFEDSYTGVSAAVAAGMRVVGIRTTHGNLPGTSITVDNFRSGELTSWLAAQSRV
jgi:HAD superfamily hydrolase (TIGR01509 family)